MILLVHYFNDKFCITRVWKSAPLLGTELTKFSRKYFFSAGESIVQFMCFLILTMSTPFYPHGSWTLFLWFCIYPVMTSILRALLDDTVLVGWFSVWSSMSLSKWKYRSWLWRGKCKYRTQMIKRIFDIILLLAFVLLWHKVGGNAVTSSVLIIERKYHIDIDRHIQRVCNITCCRKYFRTSQAKLSITTNANKILSAKERFRQSRLCFPTFHGWQPNRKIWRSYLGGCQWQLCLMFLGPCLEKTFFMQ